MDAFWGWDLQQGEEGRNIDKYSPQLIADAIFWEGDPEELVAAMRDVGFIEADGTVHEWDSHEGQYWKTREKNKNRKAEQREREREEKEIASPVTPVSRVTPLYTEREPDREREIDIPNSNNNYKTAPQREQALALLERFGLEGNMGNEQQALALIREHGENLTNQAMEIACNTDGVHNRFKYASGILTNWRKNAGAQPTPQKAQAQRSRRVSRNYEQRTYTREQDESLFMDLFADENDDSQ